MSNLIKNIKNKIGDVFIEIFYIVGLFVIGFTIVWSAVAEYLIIMQQGYGFVSLKDILLFI